MRLEEFWLVKLAKSPLSINATFAPLEESAAAATAPLIPAPIIRTSKDSLANLLILLSLRFMATMKSSHNVKYY